MTTHHRDGKIWAMHERVLSCQRQSGISGLTESPNSARLALMDVAFADSDLERLEQDARFQMGLAASIVSAYRKRLGFVRDADSLRALYEMRSLRLEKLKGKRQHQYSIRLNDQFRLIVEIDQTKTPTEVLVVGIEDYH